MNTGNKGSQDTGHQATKYSDIREMGRKSGILKWFNLHAWDLDTGRENPHQGLQFPALSNS